MSNSSNCIAGKKAIGYNAFNDLKYNFIGVTANEKRRCKE